MLYLQKYLANKDLIDFSDELSRLLAWFTDSKYLNLLVWYTDSKYLEVSVHRQDWSQQD